MSPSWTTEPRTPRGDPDLASDPPAPVPKQWICELCGWIYDPAEGDPDGGIAPGTPFEDIPGDWICPICGATKADFRELEPGERITGL